MENIAEKVKLVERFYKMLLAIDKGVVITNEPDPNQNENENLKQQIETLKSELQNEKASTRELMKRLGQIHEGAYTEKQNP